MRILHGALVSALRARPRLSGAVRDGIMVGVLLAAAEALATVVKGTNISRAYLALLAAFDVGIGLAVAVAAAGIRTWGEFREEDHASRFASFTGALVAVFVVEKLFMTATFRGGHALAGALSLIGLLAAGLLVIRRSLIVRGRTTTVDASYIGLAVVIPLLLWGRHLARSLARVLIDQQMLAVGALLGVGLVCIVMTYDRWSVRGNALSRRWVLLSMGGGGFLLALGLAQVRVTHRPAFSVAGRRTAATARPNVILISVDTLRPDRLSLYGYARDTTPNLRRLARESVVFTHALSPGTWTVPGHAAMLTGRFPGVLGAMRWNSALPSEANTLAERLGSAGYRTGAVVANAGSLAHQRGWAQGFDFYSDEARRAMGYLPLLTTALSLFPEPSARATSPSKSAREINDLALAWVGADPSAPFLLFLNYMDTHAPYMPPDPWPDRYPGRRVVLWNPVPAVIRAERGLTKAESLHYSALYDGAVAYVDEEIGRLLAGLSELGRLENSILVVTSDHGEFFGEHGLLRHAIGPYEPVHRIPLMVRYPRAMRRGTEDGWVELVDVVPTILQALGLPPSEDLDGEAMPGPTHAMLLQHLPFGGSTAVYPGGAAYTGLYQGPWKLVAFDDGTPALFNVEDDPGETRDLARAEPDRTTAMQASLAEANVRNPRRRLPGVRDPELEERLKAAGYVW